MKAFIVYFSGTGNTEMVSNEIVSALKAEAWDAAAISVENLDDRSRDFNFRLRTMDMLGFGFPVYKLDYPAIMEKIFPFLENLRPSGKPFFVFSTYSRFASTALNSFARKMKLSKSAEDERPHIPIAVRAFKCPSNGIASLKKADNRAYKEVMYFEPQIINHIHDFVNEILSGYKSFRKDRCGINQIRGTVSVSRKRFIDKIERSCYPLLYVDAGLCVGCGLCAKRCPENNLIMRPVTESSPVAEALDAVGCLHCLRCMHICPKKAISFGPRANGPLRYTPRVRKKLYAGASASPPEGSEKRLIIFRPLLLIRKLFDYLYNF